MEPLTSRPSSSRLLFRSIDKRTWRPLPLSLSLSLFIFLFIIFCHRFCFRLRPVAPWLDLLGFDYLTLSIILTNHCIPIHTMKADLDMIVDLCMASFGLFFLKSFYATDIQWRRIPSVYFWQSIVFNSNWLDTCAGTYRRFPLSRSLELPFSITRPIEFPPTRRLK